MAASFPDYRYLSTYYGRPTLAGNPSTNGAGLAAAAHLAHQRQEHQHTQQGQQERDRLRNHRAVNVQPDELGRRLDLPLERVRQCPQPLEIVDGNLVVPDQLTIADRQQPAKAPAGREPGSLPGTAAASYPGKGRFPLLSSVEVFLHEPPYFIQLVAHLLNDLTPLPFGTFKAFVQFTKCLTGLPSFGTVQVLRQFMPLPLNMLESLGQLISLTLRLDNLFLQSPALTFNLFALDAMKLLSQLVPFPMNTFEFAGHFVLFPLGSLKLFGQFAVFPLTFLLLNSFEFPCHFISFPLNLLELLHNLAVLPFAIFMSFGQLFGQAE